MIGGRNTNFQHGSHGALSSLVDYTTSIMSMDVPLAAKEADATVYGDGYESYEATFKNGIINVTYKYTVAMYDILFAIWDGDDTVDWQLGPNGTGSGEVKLTGSMVLLELGLPLPVGDVIKCPVKFRISGAITPAHF